MPKDKTQDQTEISTEEKPAAPETGVSMDDLTEVEQFPEIDNEAVDSIMRQNAENKTTGVPLQSMSQTEEKFNPEIHRTNPDGTPALTKTGKFRKKKGWKLIKPEAQTAQSAVKKESLTSRAAARIVSGTLEKLSMVLVSDEFQYTPPEKESNIEAWERCIDYYGGVHISPPLELAANHMKIILARMDKPKTQSRMAQAYFWIKSKFGRKAKNGALFSSRKDGSGKDDMGAKESAQPAKTGEKLPNP